MTVTAFPLRAVSVITVEAGAGRFTEVTWRQDTKGSDGLTVRGADGEAYVAASVGGPAEMTEALFSADAAVDLIDPLGDGRLDAASAQTEADLRGRVALVGDAPPGRGPELARSAPLDADAGRDLLKLGAAVDVYGGDRESKWSALPVAGELDLRGQPVTGPADHLTRPKPSFGL